MKKATRILVTGGAGYVGSLLTPALIDKGYEVTVLDWFIFEPKLFSNIRSKRLTTIKGDIRNKDLIQQTLQTVDTVIHLAGMSNDPSAALDPQVTIDINLTATINLAKTAKTVGVKRLVIASSASIYGIQDKPATETTPCHPLTVYSQCKLQSEEEILPLNDKNFTVTAVRPATLSGFAPRLRLDLVVNNMASQAAYFSQLKIYGGEQYRPNLSVKDMVAAYLNLIEQDPKVIGGKSYNIAESNLTISDIAHKIKLALNNKQIKIETLESDDQRSYWVDASKSQQELGFTPTYSVDNSIREIISVITNGTIPNPTLPKFRNVQVLQNIDLSRIVK